MCPQPQEVELESQSKTCGSWADGPRANGRTPEKVSNVQNHRWTGVLWKEEDNVDPDEGGKVSRECTVDKTWEDELPKTDRETVLPEALYAPDGREEVENSNSNS